MNLGLTKPTAEQDKVAGGEEFYGGGARAMMETAFRWVPGDDEECMR